MAAFDLSMLDLPCVRTPKPTPAPSPSPEEATCEDSPLLGDAALEPATVAQPEPEPEDMHILHSWNASLASIGELHQMCPDLRQECFQQLEDWLRHWELLDGFMRSYAADMKWIQLDLLVSDEQAPLLADCVRLGKVSRPTILDWKRQHEELMACAAEEKAKVKAVGGVTKKIPFAADEGEEELKEEDTDAGSDASCGAGGTIFVKPLKESLRRAKGKGKGKGKAQAEHPDMGEPKYGGRMTMHNCNDPPFHTSSVNSAPATHATPHKVQRKMNEDCPPAGHTTMDDVGESELDITNLPPLQQKKKKKEGRVMLSLLGHTRLPPKSDEAAHPVAGPSCVRNEDGEVVRLRVENMRLQEENAALRESHVHQHTFLLDTHHHMRAQQEELLSMSNKFYTWAGECSNVEKDLAEFVAAEDQE
ncbi:hypothetical protein EDD22DRAFT_948480 [Suillus occidentalis]|nr:hypothetical protein EDD22DRAFT_948480 [Suillus occidentalis]